MAEIEIGKQCSVSSCKQLDFLPFLCSECSAIFCLEHRSTTSHHCQGKAGEEKEDKLNTLSTSHAKSASAECFYKGCNVRDLIPVKCDYCEQEFCLRHRHQQDHSCPKFEVEKYSAIDTSKQNVQIEKKEKTGRGGAKSSRRAAKVALMKMKLHAVGDSGTPQEERIYLSIILPDEPSAKPKPMFFSKKWSVGRIIDQISKMHKLKNENNQKNSKKLRLFEKCPKRKLTIGNSLETEMTTNADTLFNGSELTLEYVDAEM